MAAVNAAVFSGYGRLAFVSAGRLFVLDGTVKGEPAVLHSVAMGKVPTGMAAGAPAWSADGRWLAFLVGKPGIDGAVSGGTVWIAAADGQHAKAVLRNAGTFAWSPKADVLAALSGTILYTVHPGQPAHGLWGDPGFTGGPVWSPDGAQLAVAVINRDAKQRFTSSAVDIIAARGGLGFSNFAFSASDAFILDAWWPGGQGPLAWSDPLGSASLAADGLPLVAYSLGNGPYGVTLGTTLVHPSFAVPTRAGVTLVAGGERYAWRGKTIRSCDTSGKGTSVKCGPAMNATPAPVNLDPAWAPGAQEPVLAFVHGKALSSASVTQAALRAWYRTRQLWLWIGIGGNPLPVTRAGPGVAAPVWSASARYILYVRDNALWLIQVFRPGGLPATSAPVRIVSKLFPGDWPNYYAYTAWQSQFAWHG